MPARVSEHRIGPPQRKFRIKRSLAFNDCEYDRFAFLFSKFLRKTFEICLKIYRILLVECPNFRAPTLISSQPQ
ncbi:unnamed protein product [Larinioides sclopetarius]|uniref:Uncharacterized protein n=1 Tax=Larinioides sclopetarius TaxID=280406 RepID=A0AAV1YSZ8_9ARAC